MATGLGVKTGHLKDESVTTAKLAVDAVTSTKLQSHPTDSARRAVGPQHVQAGAVSITQLRARLVTDVEVSVPAAPAAGQVAELPLTIDVLDGHAFHLVSVHYVGPRPAVPGTVTSSFTWHRRNTLFKPGAIAQYQHRHDVLIQNPNTVAISVACRVYRLDEQ